MEWILILILIVINISILRSELKKQKIKDDFYLVGKPISAIHIADTTKVERFNLEED